MWTGSSVPCPALPSLSQVTLGEISLARWEFLYHLTGKVPVVPTMIPDTNLGLSWREEKVPLKRCLPPLLLWSQVPSKPAQIRAMSSSVSFFNLLRYAHLYKAPSDLLKATSDAGLLSVIPHHGWHSPIWSSISSFTIHPIPHSASFLKCIMHAPSQGLWHLVSQISSLRIPFYHYLKWVECREPLRALL